MGVPPHITLTFWCFCCNYHWYNKLNCWWLPPFIIVLFSLFILKTEIFSIRLGIAIKNRNLVSSFWIFGDLRNDLSFNSGNKHYYHLSNPTSRFLYLIICLLKITNTEDNIIVWTCSTCNWQKKKIPKWVYTWGIFTLSQGMRDYTSINKKGYPNLSSN